MFVTYDQSTVPDTLIQWAAEGRDHAGVFFADANTVSPASPGGVARALHALIRQLEGQPTANLIRHLRPA